MLFVDRERELAALERCWKSRDAQLMIVYGKRRVGKTELIKRFVGDKPHVYFLAQRIKERENLAILGESIGKFFGDDVLSRHGFDQWRHVFEYLARRARRRMVLVVDEFPFLAEENRGISSIFQHGWDEWLKSLPIVVILCGSSIAMMEEETLSEKAPLYGRRTGQVLLAPFAFLTSRLFYPRASFDRALELYAIAGGNPCYLRQFLPHLTVEENILRKVLQPEALLYREIDFILREELREPRNYWAILRAIALGKTRVSEIANETGLEKTKLHAYLFALEDLHIVRKEVPVTERIPQKSRRGVYILQDQFFKFWFRCVLPNRGLIEEGRTDLAMKRIADDIRGLVAENYERVAGDILVGYEKDIFPMARRGRWWDRHEEIDLVALDEDGGNIFFGEVKWSRRPVGVDILENLRRKSRAVDWRVGARTEHYGLFSRSGFTPALRSVATKEGIRLFHKDEMIAP